MKVHVLQHVPFEDIGSMSTWLAERDAAISYTRFYESPALPVTNDFDLLIAMGGPMSVNDEATLPWLEAEKQFIRAAIGNGSAVLGVCLGAQLIASALGARVFANSEKEIGWFDIEATGSEATSFRFPARSTVFHWHGETFELPRGAIRLAQSTGCANQAFQVGERVIGVQFHMETTPGSAAALVSHCRNELVAGLYVQSEADILGRPHDTYKPMNQLMVGILNYLTRQIN